MNFMPQEGLQDWRLQSGDLIQINDADGQEQWYTAGTIARLTTKAADGMWWADFNDIGNPEGSFAQREDGNAEWCVGSETTFSRLHN